jgi:hypothetical protein
MVEKNSGTRGKIVEGVSHNCSQLKMIFSNIMKRVNLAMSVDVKPNIFIGLLTLLLLLWIPHRQSLWERLGHIGWAPHHGS